PAFLGADNPEHIDQLAGFHEVDATTVTLPPGFPAVVLRHGETFDILPPSWPIAEIDVAWREQQEAMARVLDAQLLVADQSGHAIPFDQPDLVVDATRAVVEAVRDPGTWATPIATPLAAADRHRPPASPPARWWSIRRGPTDGVHAAAGCIPNGRGRPPRNGISPPSAVQRRSGGNAAARKWQRPARNSGVLGR